MKNLHIALLALIAGPLAAQVAEESPLDVAAFRKQVQDGLPEPIGTAVKQFARRKEDLAIPILTEAIRARLADTGRESEKEVHWFVVKAFGLISYWATPRAIEATADLCSADQKDCPWMVLRVLGGGDVWGRPYTTAYEIIERHPELTGLVVPWAQRRLVYPHEELTFARDVVRREREGHPLDDDDPIRSGLPAATRELLRKAVEKARTVPPPAAPTAH
jgi:hypothetical protein